MFVCVKIVVRCRLFIVRASVVLDLSCMCLSRYFIALFSGQGTRSFVFVVSLLVVQCCRQYANTTWSSVCRRASIIDVFNRGTVLCLVLVSVRCACLQGTSTSTNRRCAYASDTSTRSGANVSNLCTEHGATECE